MKIEAKSKRGAGMRVHMPALSFLIIFFLILAMGGNAFAIEIGDELIPLGRTTGIKMYSEGATIVGFSDGIDGGNPAKKAGLVTGDTIISVNDKAIKTKGDLINYLKTADGSAMKVVIKRDGENKNITLTPSYDEANGAWRIGAWIRDSVAGIGTITYVDPKTGSFGALGHGITDVDTGKLVDFKSGSIMGSSVASVRKGAVSEPGELKGEFDLTKDQGVLYSNTGSGIFGKLDDTKLYSGLNAVKTLPRSAIKEGKAYILSNVSGEEIEKFDIEIVRVYSGSDNSNRDMMIRITDKKLLGITGGIVQGMSGSPIIQNGSLIGAVTHVLINDPTRGYAISMETMLASAG